MFPAAHREDKGHRKETDRNPEPGAGQVTSVTPTYRATVFTVSLKDGLNAKTGSKQLWVQEEVP